MTRPGFAVIGGGLAGPEAALTAARRGCEVDLYEMRSVVDGTLRSTPAHQTADFAELVCSNSLKSESENSAPWLLKQEMRRAGCALLACADASAVPAGHALAVDRVEFSRLVAHAIEQESRITVHREEVTALDPGPAHHRGHRPAYLGRRSVRRLPGSPAAANWPFTTPSAPSSKRIRSTWSGSTSPPATTKAPPITSTAPCPKRNTTASTMPWFRPKAVESKEWEKLEYFEGCLPIEELARRGRDTLRFGPMKPVGLRDPRTGKIPWAVVQLRCENLRADSYNLVGLQNHLKFGEQARVLRLIPGLEKAKFLRYGQIHRNTYINAPRVLTETLTLRDHPRILIAGQLSGVEGYTESIATGMLAGLYAAQLAHGQPAAAVPRGTALGSLVHYITHAQAEGLPAGQHHLRPAAAAGGDLAQADPRQAGAAPAAVRARPGGI